MYKILTIKIRKLAKKYKAIQFLGGECEECGENSFFSLEFHHKEGSEKEYTINHLTDYRWSLIEKEIKKCKLLCRNCHAKIHYNINSTTHYSNNKKIFLKFKGVDVCEKCGYNECNASLDFHHIDEKLFNIGDVTKKYHNLETLTYTIEKELNKCEVLCKNCHAEEQNDIEFFEKYKDEIIKKSKTLEEIQPKIDRLKVKELYESGVIQKDIAKYFNSSTGTISDIFKELNISKPKIDDKVKVLYENGVIQAEIARRLNVRRSTIFSIIKRLQLK